jgi:uncharacterized OB-fold protein
MIVPESIPLTAPYWEAARKGVVLLQRCTSCEAIFHPPQPACSSCRLGDLEWFEASGRGRLAAFTLVEHAAHTAIGQQLPYFLALVELAEGPLFICNLMSPTDVARDLQVGASVEIRLGPTPGGLQLPQAYQSGSETIRVSSEARTQARRAVGAEQHP